MVDRGSNLTAFARMDNAWLGSKNIAIKKAQTSNYVDRNSEEIGKLSQPVKPLFGIEHSNGGLISFAGGVLIKAADGNIIGAIGVSGGAVEQDIEVAEAGAKVNGVVRSRQTTVTAIVNPTFAPVDTLCSGNNSPLLPSTSLNGIAGTWSPAQVSNTHTGMYRFTPNAGSCAKAFTMPVVVRPAVVLARPAVFTSLTVGSTTEVTIVHTLKGQCSNTNGFVLTDSLPAGFTYISSTPAAVLNNGVLSFAPANIAANETKTFTQVLRAPNGKCYIDTVINYNGEDRLLGDFTTTGTPGWIKSGTAAYSGNTSWLVKDTAETTTSALTAVATYAAPGANLSLFSFWHKYNSEQGYDGGVLEFSTDGTNWNNAGAYIISNGYNSRIDTAAQQGRGAFSGNSNGFVQTIVNVSSFGTTPVAFRYRFITDGTIAGEGWYVDDIVRVNGCGGLLQTRLLNQMGQVMDSLVLPVFVTAAAPLPLYLLVFTAGKSAGQVQLQWKTANEVGVSRYEVEHSTPGTPWTIIGTVSAGNNVGHSYQWVHPTPAEGHNYYRLKMIDRDGSWTYSPVRAVEFAGSITEQMRLAPNPVHTHAVLYIPPATTNTSLRIYHANGSLVRQVKVDVGTRQVRLNTSDLPAGMYTIHYSDKILRMVVQH